MHACGRHLPPPVTRREMLGRAAHGFGMVALWDWLARNAGARPSARPPHARPQAQSIIFLYMDGGPSQVDTFDPKPRLAREHGQPFGLKMEATQFNNHGRTLASPWTFTRHGQSGLPVSSLFPRLATCADELCVIRSMTSSFSEHTNANYFLHTGLGQSGRPSMGAWVTYGLGSANQSLPGFIVLNGGLVPPGGLDNFSNGFLPATFQGSVFKGGAQPLANLHPQESRPALQENKLRLLRRLDRAQSEGQGAPDEIESAIANQELAFRMQSAVPELLELRGESDATRSLYGLNSPFANTASFGRNCLLARRLVERGVRFVEITCPSGNGDRWDQHSALKDGHTKNALSVDQGMAALIMDLKNRGLLESTLLVWAGEFGRTPFAQGGDGRDHNPFGFSIWMAGGGVKGGHIHGATDEYGYKAVEGRTHIHDLHATMLHLLGIDHKRLTLRISSRDMRLTDVHGEVLHEILA